MTSVALITTLVEATTQLLKRMPDYDQKLRENWNELQRLYNNEIHKPEIEWDADLLLNLKSEIEIQSTQIIKAAKDA